jgi:uncharacterized protein
MNPVLVDTGFLVALYDRNDAFHSRCIRAHKQFDRPYVTCEAVLTESFHLLRHLPAAGLAILKSVEMGILDVPFTLKESATEVARILDKYCNLPASLADACLVQMADESDTGDILTLDSDFKRYRWRRNRSFNLLIPLD